VFAGSVAVLVGGGRVGIAEGTGCVSVGVPVTVGTGGLALAGTLVGNGDGDEVDVGLGWSVDVGIGVFVATASTTRVLVGVGVTAGAPGAQVIGSHAATAVAARRDQDHRRLFMAVVCSILPPDGARDPCPVCP
jgi:hypothetical protein